MTAMNFDKLDTTHLTGHIPTDVQFIKDNLTIEDADMFKAQVQFIMSVGNDRMKVQEQEKPE
jgi:hypothetical protein